mmetsp:Transcript_690/g.1247  ORF Transcript_690/g.1247 Transcript_690/m.1247 type:complete len:89 (+) Transcript_690:4524-4790(+)
MDIEAEVAEYRPHVKVLAVDGSAVSVVTLDDIEFLVEATPGGYRIVTTSLTDVTRTQYDDLNQLLSSLSAGYRQSVASSLFAKLQRLS